METQSDPRQPKPAPNSLPAKGTSDPQSADADNATNLPRPDSTPEATPAETAGSEPTPAQPASSAPTETPADPSAASGSSEAPGESDPGASNTSNDEPL